MHPAVYGLVAMVVVLVLLYRLKQRDIAQAAAALGLRPVQSGAQSNGTSAEGIDFHETVMAEGTVDGVRAQLLGRITRPLILKKARRNVGTQFTVLALYPATPPRSFVRVQPAGMLREIETVVTGAPAVVVTGDAAFDAAYKVYAEDPTSALVLLTQDLRARLIALRTSAQVAAPGSTADYLTSGLLLGTFEVAPDRSTYHLYGSPTKKTAAQCRVAAPLLARLAGQPQPQ